MRWLVWRYEMRRCGVWTLALPLLAAVATAMLAALPGRGGAMAAIWLPGMVLPLAAGGSAVSAIGREEMLELRLTLPKTYATAVLRRIAAVTASIAVSSAALLPALEALGRPIGLESVLLGGESLSAALVACAGCGVTRTGSTGAGAALVLVVWLGTLLFAGQVPLPVRVMVFILVAVVGMVGMMRRLGAPASLLETENRDL